MDRTDASAHRLKLALTAPDRRRRIPGAGRGSMLLTDEDTAMHGKPFFERLAASVESISRHAYYPGLADTIDGCLEDIDDLLQSGRITPAQREALRFILMRMSLNAA